MDWVAGSADALVRGRPLVGLLFGKKIGAEVQKMFADPDVKKNFLDAQYFESIAGSPEDLTKRINAEEPIWHKLIETAHIKVE